VNVYYSIWARKTPFSIIISAVAIVNYILDITLEEL